MPGVKNKIKELSELIVSQIAAGEVIESPVAVVKELLENSLDAEPEKIEIFIQNNGLDSIQIRDDGSGIDKNDLPLALKSFATSKIKSIEDIHQIITMGFRGEALSSIRSVSKITIDSRVASSPNGWKISAEADTIYAVSPSAIPKGTRVVVEELFFNVPVRKKFISAEKRLKKEYIDLVTTYAIAHENKSFSLFLEGDNKIQVPKSKNLKERMEKIYTAEFSEKLIPLYNNKKGITVEGFISGINSYHSTSGFIKFYVNKRPVEYKGAIALLRRAYGELLPSGSFPAAFLFFEIDPDLIDVNIHPQKKEIRFDEEIEFEKFLITTLSNTLSRSGAIPYSHIKNRPSPEVVNRNNNTLAEPSLQYAIELSAFEKKASLSETEHFSEHSDAATPVNKESRDFKPQKILGKILDTYIVASSEKGIFLVDQHTAHERIRYEEILEKLKNKIAVSQKLLHPLAVQFSPGEKEALKNYQSEIESIGFFLEDLGPAGICITDIPEYVKNNMEEKALRLLLTLLENNSKNHNKVSSAELFDQMAKSMACRGAVKKGEEISLASMEELLKELVKCKEPSRCPHGRPVIVFINKDEIDMMFKR